MNRPVAITFVDNKMLDIAQEQKENFSKFNIDHVIYNLEEVKAYDTFLWLKLIDLTIDAIKRYDKVLRLDAEVRIHKDLPNEWLLNDNVLFQPYPFLKDPFYVAINTGQLILSKSGIEFLEILKECILAMIPPDNDTRLNSGQGHHVEDEWPSCIAIRLSKLKYIQEQLCYDRRLNKNCAANRGIWLESNTTLTHPTLHNWNWEGGGHFKTNETVNHLTFINHFSPSMSLKEVEFIANLVLSQNSNKNLWKKIATECDDGVWEINDWLINPSKSLVAPKGKSFRNLVF